MNPTLRVALHGFSDFEQRALASFFRLASAPSLALEQVARLSAADLIVANADHAGAVARLEAAGRLADTVFIGAHAPAGAAACLPRPIDALHVLRELEALAARRRSAASPGTPARAVPVLQPRQPGFSALLVDDSAIALRHLQLRLQRMGIESDLASGSARALELLSQRIYGFVFIDVELGEESALDGLALCQHIRRQHRHLGGHSPVLVLISAHHSPLDRARGSFAGCDHYLAKPADDESLHQLLSQHRGAAARS